MGCIGRSKAKGVVSEEYTSAAAPNLNLTLTLTLNLTRTLALAHTLTLTLTLTLTRIWSGPLLTEIVEGTNGIWTNLVLTLGLTLSFTMRYACAHAYLHTHVCACMRACSCMCMYTMYVCHNVYTCRLFMPAKLSCRHLWFGWYIRSYQLPTYLHSQLTASAAHGERAAPRDSRTQLSRTARP